MFEFRRLGLDGRRERGGWVFEPGRKRRGVNRCLSRMIRAESRQAGFFLKSERHGAVRPVEADGAALFRRKGPEGLRLDANFSQKALQFGRGGLAGKGGRGCGDAIFWGGVVRGGAGLALWPLGRILNRKQRADLGASLRQGWRAGRREADRQSAGTDQGSDGGGKPETRPAPRCRLRCRFQGSSWPWRDQATVGTLQLHGGTYRASAGCL